MTATAAATPTAWALPAVIDGEEGEGYELRVSRQKDGTTVITWLCGDQRTFNDEGLTELVTNLDIVKPHEVWYRITDLHGQTCSALVRNGRLYVTAAPVDDPRGHVDFRDVTELVAPEPPAKPEAEIRRPKYTPPPKAKKGPKGGPVRQFFARLAGR